MAETTSPAQSSELSPVMVMSLSDYPVAVIDGSEGQPRTTAQQLDSLNAEDWISKFTPGTNVPQEIAYNMDGAHHSIFSGEQLPTALKLILQNAEKTGLKVSIPESDTKPWVHVQYYPAGVLVGVEVLKLDVLQKLRFENGKPLSAGQSPIQNLQAHWYEVKPPSEATDADTETVEAGAIIEGVGQALADAGDIFRNLQEAYRKRADELGVPVSQLPTEEMNAILRQQHSNNT